MKITFQLSQQTFIYQKTTCTLLELAQQNGLILAQGCTNGYCKTCCVQLLQGKVKLINSNKIQHSGQITICQAVPLGDCIIDA